MKFTRSIFALSAMLVLSASLASAQVPSIGVVAPAMRSTYSVATAITPAASATDLLTITGSATKTLRITRVACSGTATATASATVNLIKRSTANAGGTSVSVTSIPHDSTNSAASGTVRNYSANVATPGTLIGTLRTATLTLATSTAPAVADRLVWDFGTGFTTDEPVTLRGTSQVLAVNGGGNSFPSGSALNCGFEWNEQ